MSKNFNEGFEAGDRVRNKYHQAGIEFTFLNVSENFPTNRMIVKDSDGTRKMYLSSEMEKL
jgi:hypothetical protein